ncbi:methyl-accepting chemotaxis protein [Cognaticolwellia mytili]|uniref:methyl-accepting chemotaxis protein n=1 Tax=Cognaticolwellia mytili TaxID=1888913 RepID=UPI000A176103|nr:methyl-accepting chemotaxis protein [Cognaticolwellia mytili]
MFNGIRVRFTWTVVAIVTLLLSVFGWYNYIQTAKSLQASIKEQANQTLQRLSVSLPAPVWNYDTAIVIKNIESELGSNIISQIMLKNGEEILALRSKKTDGRISDNTKDAISASYTISADLFYIEEDEKNPVGQLLIGIDSRSMEKALAASLRNQIAQILMIAIVIVTLIWFLLRGLVLSPLLAITLAVKDIAEGEGDLTQRLDVRRNDEISKLAEQVNRFMEKLAGIISKVNDTSQHLIDSTNQSQIFIGNMHEELQSQQAEIDLITGASNHLSEHTNQVNSGTSEAAEYTEEITKIADKGQFTVNQAIKVIHGLLEEIDTISNVVKKLEQEVSNIGAVSEVIQAIAEQTNLLALNAAIEAARAGESGRGFAVVADEVRSLAQRTQHSTTEIDSMIEQLQTSSSKVVEIMARSHEYTSQSVEEIQCVGETIEEIVVSIGNISDMNSQIAQTSEEQSEVIGKLNNNVLTMSDASLKSVQLAGKTSDISNESLRYVEELKQLMEKFKVH